MRCGIRDEQASVPYRAHTGIMRTTPLALQVGAQPDMPLMPYPVGNKEGHQDDQQEFPLIHPGIPSPSENRLFKQFGMSACPDKSHHSQKIPSDMTLPIPQPVHGQRTIQVFRTQRGATEQPTGLIDHIQPLPYVTDHLLLCDGQFAMVPVGNPNAVEKLNLPGAEKLPFVLQRQIHHQQRPIGRRHHGSNPVSHIAFRT